MVIDNSIGLGFLTGYESKVMNRVKRISVHICFESQENSELSLVVCYVRPLLSLSLGPEHSILNQVYSNLTLDDMQKRKSADAVVCLVRAHPLSDMFSCELSM